MEPFELWMLPAVWSIACVVTAVICSPDPDEDAILGADFSNMGTALGYMAAALGASLLGWVAYWVLA